MTGLVGAFFVISIILGIALSFSTDYLMFIIISIVLSIVAITGYFFLKDKKRISQLQTVNIDNGVTAPRGLPYIYFSIIFLFSLIYWLGNFPGGFNLDAYGQWLQAHHMMQYSDWHPFVSTLLIQLAISIVDSFPIIILVQITAFSAAMSYLLFGIQKQGVDYRILVGMAVFTGFNPAIGLNTICLTKDVQFTILITVLTGIFVRIISSEGKWLHTTFHLLIIIVLSTLAALVRHNGILFVIPAFFLIYIVYKESRKQMLIICLSFIVLMIIVKGPLTTGLKVEKHDNVLGETIGIPMEMMANALVSDKDLLPQDVHDFLNMIADDEAWAEHHYLGEWDSCKWEFGGTELLKDASVKELLQYTVDTIRSCPQACYEAFRESTRIVWSPFTRMSFWTPDVNIVRNIYNITSSPIAPFDVIATSLCSISCIPVFSYLFWNVGFYSSLVMIVWLLMKKTEKAGNMVLVVPILMYTFGTMLFLTGPNQRYFYCELVVVPPVLMFFLFRKRKEIRE